VNTAVEFDCYRRRLVRHFLPRQNVGNTNTFRQLFSVLKSRVKTFWFNQAFTEPWSDLPPAPLRIGNFRSNRISNRIRGSRLHVHCRLSCGSCVCALATALESNIEASQVHTLKLQPYGAIEIRLLLLILLLLLSITVNHYLFAQTWDNNKCNRTKRAGQQEQ